jgi:hypothetical protein
MLAFCNAEHADEYYILKQFFSLVSEVISPYEFDLYLAMVSIAISAETFLKSPQRTYRVGQMKVMSIPEHRDTLLFTRAKFL